MAFHGIVLAAGEGTRFGGVVPKQLAMLAGRPVVGWSVATMITAGVEDLVVVAAAGYETATRGAIDPVAARVVLGGATRADSVRNALAVVEGEDGDEVLVHDAARPLVSVALIDRIRAALVDAVAVTPAVAVADTVVTEDDGLMGEQVDRTRLRRVQTPQGFRLGTLREAHRLAASDPDPTDDAGLVARHLGLPVRLVPGDPANLKITTADDLDVAAALLASRGISEQSQHR